MSRFARFLLSVILITALAVGGLTASTGLFDAYKVAFREARWDLKYNNALDAISSQVAGALSSLASLSDLIVGWGPMENQDILISAAATYVDADTFTLPGDYTAQFAANARVRVDLGSGVLKGSYVASSSFGGGVTTVNIHDAVLTNPIGGVWVTATRNGLFPYGPGYVVARDYGAPGLAALQAAIAAIGANNRTLVITPGDWAISDNLTISANITLKPERGATLAIANTKTLTINGGFEAGLYQVFSCAGTGMVVFGTGSISTAYPEWWGAKADNSTECATAFQAAFYACPSLSGVVGTYKISSPVYLDQNVSVLTYKFSGQGRGTCLDISGLTAETYAFHLNQDSGGVKVPGVTNAIHRFVGRDFYVLGSASQNTSFIYYNEASPYLENVWSKNLLYLVRGTGYADNITLLNIWAHEYRSGGWVFYGSQGDSFYARQVFVGPGGEYSRGSVFLRNANGAKIEACNGGQIKAYRSQVTIEDGHLEHTIYDHSIYLQSSHAVVKNNSITNDPTNSKYPIYIDDSGSATGDRSVVVLDGNTFWRYQLVSTDARGADVYIHTPLGSSKYVFKNNFGKFPVGGGYIPTSPQHGIIVTSSDATLNTELAAKKAMLGGECEIRYVDTALKVTPIGNGGIWNTDSMPTTAISAISSLASASGIGYGSLLAANTYYYRAAVYTLMGQTAKSAEVSNNPAGNNYIMSLNITAGPYCVLRLWRGVAADTYDSYVDIPMNVRSAAQFKDSGTHVNGFVWITVGVPTPPTVDTAYRGSVSVGGVKTLYAAAAPTSAGFAGAVGDRWITNNPAVGQPKGASCTVAGTPGTWVSEGNL